VNALAQPVAANAFIESRFVVPGMRCQACIARLEGRLPLIAGVAGARVHFGVRQLTISHDPAMTVPDLLGAINSIGFDAQPLGTGIVGATAIDDGLKPLLLALGVASFAAMNIMLLSVAVWSGADPATRQLFHWLSAAIAIPAIAYAGRPFFRSAWSALRHRRTNMDVPISIGIVLTTAMSLFETMTGGAHAWFDGATMLCAFLLAGRVLDAMMRARAHAAVAALVRQAPAGATVLGEQGHGQWTNAGDLLPGMIMLVAAGERLATDAVVIEGRSTIDRSLITGESAPAVVAEGDTVEAGVLNLDAPLTVKVTAKAEDSSLSDIARLMDAAAQAKSGYTRIADRAARLYAPAVHGLAALSFAGWLITGAGWHQSLLIAVAVLLITCPCALGLAVPVAQVVASGALMRRGIMVKDGSALERLARVDRALLDKTGTLTMGRPEPDNPAELNSEAKAIALALAQHSAHPLARGVVRALQADGVVPAVVADVREEPGQGLIGKWGLIRVALVRPGTHRSGGMASDLLIGETAPITIRFTDQLRPDAEAAVSALRALGVEPSILSGDSAAGVEGVSHALGLFALVSARPEDKIAAVRTLETRGHRVLMVGDGLNDGPALAAASVSMAPGSASDVGRQAADLVFTGDSFLAVPAAIRAARRTGHIVRQNFMLAVAYNIIAVPLAIAGQVTPLIAALAMSGSSLLVVGNALRLRGAAR
jgi:Cu2+-exporting ATPase